MPTKRSECEIAEPFRSAHRGPENSPNLFFHGYTVLFGPSAQLFVDFVVDSANAQPGRRYLLPE